MRVDVQTADNGISGYLYTGGAGPRRSRAATEPITKLSEDPRKEITVVLCT